MLDGDVHVIKPGAVVLTKAREFGYSEAQLSVGDTILFAHTLYSYGGELYGAPLVGRRAAWAKGRFGWADVDVDSTGALVSAFGHVVREADLEWWVRIQVVTGKSGWAHLTPSNVNINAYAVQN
jgi:hypothetical protein